MSINDTTPEDAHALLAEAAAAACSAVLNIKGKTYPCDVPKPPGHRTHGNREAGALWECQHVTATNLRCDTCGEFIGVPPWTT